MRAGRKAGIELVCVPVLRGRQAGSPRIGVALGQQQQLGVRASPGVWRSDVARNGRATSSSESPCGITKAFCRDRGVRRDICAWYSPSTPASLGTGGRVWAEAAFSQVCSKA